ncbi:hypothetical protein S40285_00901 [Stachybotrys chlorohalonatus IBT 40285]|uniref:SMODS and SLOG-associating 2TM effector domain-containing protein n=1 Tax=Stachybotrys chlorohalonatus (strain IBT 40285) TaxID=1283841 RepID=A0A084QUM7_STAC4|nr:hypothetical protein S40285_00901 [Stachybotrys chlorohalonata IBT 40285]
MSQVPKSTDTSILFPLPSNGRELRTDNESRLDRVSATSSEELEQSDIPRHRFLTPSEWSILAHGLGGVYDNEDGGIVRQGSAWWPPAGMPPGLYRDVVYHRVKYLYMFHTISILRWTMMILQLFVGAALTALGSLSLRQGTPITILGAGNTIIAGLLALVHNSGLPDRHKFNMLEFELLQDNIKELLESRMVPADQTIDQVLARCFHQYQESKTTVTANMPASYTSRNHQPQAATSRQLSKQQNRGSKRLSSTG